MREKKYYIKDILKMYINTNEPQGKCGWYMKSSREDQRILVIALSISIRVIERSKCWKQIPSSVEEKSFGTEKRGK